MSDELQTVVRQAGEAQSQRAVALVNLYQSTTRMAVPDPDPDSLSEAMTAAAIFAGTIFGQLLVAGLVNEGDKRRAGEAMLKNFRAGIDLGRRKAMETIKTEGSA